MQASGELVSALLAAFPEAAAAATQGGSLALHLAAANNAPDAAVPAEDFARAEKVEQSASVA